jgi:Uma2 family endonuclease
MDRYILLYHERYYINISVSGVIRYYRETNNRGCFCRSLRMFARGNSKKRQRDAKSICGEFLDERPIQKNDSFGNLR